MALVAAFLLTAPALRPKPISRYNPAVALLNAPASWPSMDRTKPHAGFPFPRRKTKHRFVRLRACAAGGALAELRQRLVFAVLVCLAHCLELVDTKEYPLYNLFSGRQLGWRFGVGLRAKP